jgi:MFS family permease
MDPGLYAGAMGADAVAALILGPLFDRIGLRTMLGATLISALAPPLASSAVPKVLGALYDRSVLALVVVAMLLQGMALPILWRLTRQMPAVRRPG